jgi:hypothetical protein
MGKKITKRYIRHDESASRDAKILRMREKYGARGYGLFWEIAEYLFTSNGRSELNYKVISISIGEDVRAVRNFLSDCIEIYHLFESDGTDFWSNRILSHIDHIIDVSVERSKAGSRRHNQDFCISKQENDLDTFEIENDPDNCHAIDKQLNNKTSTINRIEINRINDNYRKRKQPRKFTEPSIEEIEAYCIERENEIDPIHFHDYYEANGWKIGKNPMKSWKAAIRTWEKNSTVKADKPSQSYDPYENLRRLG